MTTDVLAPVPTYIVSGTGPYSVPHLFAEASDLRGQLRKDGTTVNLDASAMTLVQNEETGQSSVTLSLSTATAFDGWTVAFWRETDLEQGWEGDNARELGLEAQLDKTVKGLQDAHRVASRASFRLPPGEMAPDLPDAAGRAGKLAAFDADGMPALLPQGASDLDVTMTLDFGTTASMEVFPHFVVGMKVRRWGYHSIGDGGWANLVIVPAGTGVADGGSLIDLPGSGLQAQLVHHRKIRMEWWGVTLPPDGIPVNRRAEFNTGFAYAADLSRGSRLDAEPNVAVICESDFLADDTLHLAKSNGATCEVDVTLNGRIQATTGGVFESHYGGVFVVDGAPVEETAPLPIINCRVQRSRVEHAEIDCNFLCSGIRFETATGTKFVGQDIYHFRKYSHLVLDRSNNAISMSCANVKQWLLGSADAHDFDGRMASNGNINQKNFSADCLVSLQKDFRIWGGHWGWSRSAILLLDDAGKSSPRNAIGEDRYYDGLSSNVDGIETSKGCGDVNMYGLHIMQGYGDVSVVPRYDNIEIGGPIGIECYNTSNPAYFHGGDADACTVQMYGDGLRFSPGSLIVGGSNRFPDDEGNNSDRVMIVEPRVRLYADGTNNPSGAFLQGIPNVTVGVYPRAGYSSFQGDYSEWNKLNQTEGANGTLTWGGFLAFDATGRSARTLDSSNCDLKIPTAASEDELYVVVQDMDVLTDNSVVLRGAGGSVSFQLDRGDRIIITGDYSGNSARDWVPGSMIHKTHSDVVAASAAYSSEIERPKFFLWPRYNDNEPIEHHHRPSGVFSKVYNVADQVYSWVFDGVANLLTLDVGGLRITGNSLFFSSANDNGLSTDSGHLQVHAGDEHVWTFRNTGRLRPEENDTYSIGDETHRVNELHAKTIYADNISQTPRDFPSRDAFKTWQATNPTVTDGEVKFAGGLGYEYLTGATSIPDMDDWIPHGNVRPQHMTSAVKPAAAAINAAFAFSREVYFKAAVYAIDAQVQVPAGGAIIAEGGIGGRFIDNDDTVHDESLVIFEVSFGAGIDYSDPADYFANAAIEVGSGAKVRGIAFWYPDQDLSASAPTAEYPPAITTVSGARSASITDINLGNAYRGIDARRDNYDITIERIKGFPLFRSFIHGSAINPASIEKLNFSANHVLFGSPWVSPNIAAWVANPANGSAAVELGRTTWADYDVWAYGYARGIYMTQHAADPTHGINIAGSPQNCTLKGGTDACAIGVEGDGYQGRIDIYMNFTPTVNYNIATTTYAVYCVSAGGNVTDINIMNGKVWGADQHVYYLEGQHDSQVLTSDIYKVAGAGTGTAIKLVNCLRTNVIGNNIHNKPDILTITGASQAANCVITSVDHGLTTGDSVRITDVVGMTELNGVSATVTVLTDDTFSLDGVNSTGFTPWSSGGSARILRDARGIELVGNCSGSKVALNTLTDFDGYPIRQDAGDRIHFVDNSGEGNLLTLLTDTSATKKYRLKVRDNIDDLSDVYDDINVSGGILQRSRIHQDLRFDGTGGFSGLPHGSYGEMALIRFGASNTIPDSDGALNLENRLHLSGDFNATSGDVLALVCKGNLGWHQFGASNN